MRCTSIQVADEMINRSTVIILALICSVALGSDKDKKTSPRFEDFPVKEVWEGKPAPVKLTLPSERKYQARLRGAAKEKPNFAGHYRVVIWGCGSECISGAILDLQTGRVYSPPMANDSNDEMHFSFCQSAYYPSRVGYRVNSRLLIVRCGLNFVERQNDNVPDTYYFVWENNRFRLLSHQHTSSR
jgi:hypothetical protein